MRRLLLSILGDYRNAKVKTRATEDEVGRRQSRIAVAKNIAIYLIYLRGVVPLM